MTKSLRNSNLSLTKIFTAFAKKAVRDFPQLKDRFILYNEPTHTLYRLPQKWPRTAWLKGLKKNKYMKKGIQAYARKENNYDLIVYKSRDQNHKPPQDIICTLEHELGHLVAPGGSPKRKKYTRHFAECVADTFSCIRQSPKFQMLTIEGLIWERAINATRDGLTAYNTSGVLTELKHLAQKHDLSRLTPLQSLNLAYRLSLQTALPPEQLYQLEKIFKPVAEVYKTKSSCNLKACADIMLADHGSLSPTVFSIGKAKLDPFLHHQTDILGTLISTKNLDGYKLEGPFWDDVRQKIKDREARTKETPVQRRERELVYLQALGHFDRPEDQNKLIDPVKYESKENQAYIRQRRREYAESLSNKTREFRGYVPD